MRFFFLLFLASLAFASLPPDSFGFSELPPGAFDRSVPSDFSEISTGRQLIFSSVFTRHEIIEKNDVLFSSGDFFEINPQGKTTPLSWTTSEGKTCFSKEYANHKFTLTFDPLCSVCGKKALMRFKAGTLTSSKTTVDQFLQVPCAADVLIVTRTGTKGKLLLQKDPDFEPSLKKYIAALASEKLTSKYVELDQAQAKDTFGLIAPKPVTLTKVRPREKEDELKRGFYEQTDEAYALVPQLNRVQKIVFGHPDTREKMKFLVLLGGLTQMPMPGIPYPLGPDPRYTHERFIPSDELYGRGDNLYTEKEAKVILKELRTKDEAYKAVEARSESALNALIKKMSRQSLDRAHPIRVAVGRIPLPWNERSSQVLSEKLQQYANVRTKTSKETLMVVDKCGGSDCFIERETDDTKIAEEVVCSEVICKVESPEYCEGHLGKSAKTCEPLALFKRMSTADTLYFFTHGDRGLFAAQSKDQDSYTVLTAKSVIERPEIDLSKNKPVVYSDGCYSAALDVVSPKEEKGATGFSASMPLALLKKGALLYVGSTRKVPSYKEAYKNEAGRTFSPLAKYIRLTTSSKTKINRRVGDALLEAKTLAFKQALEGNPNYKLAAIGFVLYGDPTLRAVGIADQPAAVLLDGRDVTLRPSFAYAGTGCS